MAACHQWLNLQLHSILHDHCVLTRLLTIFLFFWCHIEFQESTMKATPDEHVSPIVSMPTTKWNRGWGTATKLFQSAPFLNAKLPQMFSREQRLTFKEVDVHANTYFYVECTSLHHHNVCCMWIIAPSHEGLYDDLRVCYVQEILWGTMM